MSFMKKHPFLTVDYHSTVKLTPAETKKINAWLLYAGHTLEKLLEMKVIKAPKLEHISVSLLICGEKKIKELNSDHRNKDKVTDVLSFPSFENLRKGVYKERELFLGDLAICHQVTKRQAREFKITYFDEFIHLFFHGVLHLLGYDHEISLKEEKIMEEWENTALEIFSETKKKKKS